MEEINPANSPPEPPNDNNGDVAAPALASVALSRPRPGRFGPAITMRLDGIEKRHDEVTVHIVRMKRRAHYALRDRGALRVVLNDLRLQYRRKRRDKASWMAWVDAWLDISESADAPPGACPLAVREEQRGVGLGRRWAACPWRPQ